MEKFYFKGIAKGFNDIPDKTNIQELLDKKINGSDKYGFYDEYYYIYNNRDFDYSSNIPENTPEISWEQFLRWLKGDNTFLINYEIY